MSVLEVWRRSDKCVDMRLESGDYFFQFFDSQKYGEMEHYSTGFPCSREKENVEFIFVHQC